MAWFTHLHPDLCCITNRAEQDTLGTLSSMEVCKFNEAVLQTQKGNKKTFSYEKLDLASLHLRTYLYTASSTNKGLLFQSGYIILLADSSDRCHILNDTIRKSKRVMKSSNSGETYMFIEVFGTTCSIRHDI